MADLYLLQDGTYTDQTSKGDDGVLRGPNGLAVCLYADGSPQTLHRDAEANMNVMAAKIGKDAVDATVEPRQPADATAEHHRPDEPQASPAGFLDHHVQSDPKPE
jgi:hypothetical protein